jgi:hypothetical protein
VSPVKYELGFYIPEDGIPHSDRREDIKSYNCYTIYTPPHNKDITFLQLAYNNLRKYIPEDSSKRLYRNGGNYVRDSKTLRARYTTRLPASYVDVSGNQGLSQDFNRTERYTTSFVPVTFV